MFDLLKELSVVLLNSINIVLIPRTGVSNSYSKCSNVYDIMVANPTAEVIATPVRDTDTFDTGCAHRNRANPRSCTYPSGINYFITCVSS